MKPGDIVLPDGLDIMKIMKHSQRAFYYSVAIPAEVVSGYEIELFSQIGDHTNLKEPYKLPADNAIIYRVRSSIRPDPDLKVSEITNVIYGGCLTMSVGNEVLESPLSFLPFSLFPGADGDDPKSYDIAGSILDPHRVFTVTQDTIQRLRIEARPIARLEIPFHFKREDSRLEGSIRFRWSFIMSCPVSLSIILDCYTADYMK